MAKATTSVAGVEGGGGAAAALGVSWTGALVGKGTAVGVALGLAVGDAETCFGASFWAAGATVGETWGLSLRAVISSSA